MKIWIYIDGGQHGPYTFEQLRSTPITRETPVWYYGLPNWTPAGQAPATAPLFNTASTQGGCTECPDVPQSACAEGWQQPSCATAPRVPVADEMPRPATFLAWNIILTILCCTPFSVAGIITAIFVTKRFNSGDVAGARRMSEITEWLVILGITFGLVSAPFSMISWL